MKKRFWCVVALHTVVLAFSVFLTFGCRAPAAPEAGFLRHPEQLLHDDKIPFNEVWIKDGVDLREFKKMVVARVDTSHLLKLDWWDKVNFARGSQSAHAEKLAIFFREQLIEAFRSDSSGQYEIMAVPDRDTLVIELAIVEVVPTKVWLNLMGYLAVGALSQGTTAFEGRFRDGRTGEVIAKFKDRQHGQLDLVSVRDLTWFKHSKHTIKEWSSLLVKICRRAPEQSLTPIPLVTLKPW